MYPCIKFQSIWKTSNFGVKLVQKNMTNKNFEKTNIKIVLSIYQRTPLQNFRQFEEIKIIGPNLPKKQE